MEGDFCNKVARILENFNGEDNAKTTFLQDGNFVKMLTTFFCLTTSDQANGGNDSGTEGKSSFSMANQKTDNFV